MRTNGAGALLVLEKRVLQHLLADEAPPAGNTRDERPRERQLD
jgi:hypothetical protein